jgi:alcohol dehydrogenase class IV
MSQGANPFSDIACVEALRIAGEHLVRAVDDPHDREARERMMFAATLAGIGFGNAGVAVPHAMSYAVAGLIPTPHGMAVIVNAPAAFRFTAPADPKRHLTAAALLGAETGGAGLEDAGDLLAARISSMMRATNMPNGVGGIGFGEADLPALRDGAAAQHRLLANAPRAVGPAELERLFADALRCW